MINVVVEKVTAVKPSIIRVNAYTFRDDNTEAGILNYEIALTTQEFTSRVSEGEVVIDLDRFKDLITKHIADLQDTANLAAALNNQDIEWTLEIKDKQEPVVKDGKTLAFGEKE